MRGYFDTTQSGYPITGEYAAQGKWYVQDMRTGHRLYSHVFSVEDAFYIAGRINKMLQVEGTELATAVTAYSVIANERRIP